MPRLGGSSIAPAAVLVAFLPAALLSPYPSSGVAPPPGLGPPGTPVNRPPERLTHLQDVVVHSSHSHRNLLHDRQQLDEVGIRDVMELGAVVCIRISLPPEQVATRGRTLGDDESVSLGDGSDVEEGEPVEGVSEGMESKPIAG